MANTGQPNSGSSEFFITAPNEPLVDEPQSLNYGYTVFGQLLTGQAIYNDILNVPTTDQGGVNYDNTPVTITSASVTTTPSASVAASQFGVLQITEPNGYSGSAQITVTAHGGDSTTAQQSFAVVAAPPTPPASAAGGTGGPMVLNPVSNQTTTENSSVSFQVSAAEEQFLTATPTFTVTGTNSFTGAPANVTVTITPGASNTATVKLTPAAGFTGTIDLVAHSDISADALHDALPFTLTVTSTGPVVTPSGTPTPSRSATRPCRSTRA